MRKALLAALILLFLGGSVFAGDFTLWATMNDDLATFRAGYTEGHFEVGVSGGYMDELRPEDVDAYRAGIYGLWIVNPEAQFPVRGWFPGSPSWMPETIPVTFYVGGLLDMEFKDHKLMPALVGGAQVKTGVHGSLGAEFSQTFNQGDWGKLADAQEGWSAVLFLRWQFGPVQ